MIIVQTVEPITKNCSRLSPIDPIILMGDTQSSQY